MFILMDLEKIRETKFSQGSVTVLQIMASYQEALFIYFDWSINDIIKIVKPLED